VRVRDLTGREQVYEAHVEAGLTFEFLITLTAFGLPSEHETYEVGSAWFEHIRKGASKPLLQALDRIGSEAGKIWVNLVGLATTSPATRDVPSFLSRVQDLDPLELRLYLLGFHVPHYQQSITREVLVRAAEGDPKARDRLLADGSYFGGHAEASLSPLLRLTPQETKDVALEAMHRWHQEVFRQREGELEPVLLRDAEAKRKLLGVMPPDQVIEAASGVQFVAHPWIRQVYLIPQLTTRPWVWMAEHDDSRLYCYPVADESLGAGESEPPGRLVRLHKALGDEKRLRMLRELAASSATLQELADRFGLPKSTAHHHLAILRSAGLIRVSSDEDHRYSVRRDVIPEMSSLLNAYLGPDEHQRAREA
jgi:DNA-binding transcriptional ArsR family regulator